MLTLGRGFITALFTGSGVVGLSVGAGHVIFEVNGFVEGHLKGLKVQDLLRDSLCKDLRDNGKNDADTDDEWSEDVLEQFVGVMLGGVGLERAEETTGLGDRNKEQR